MAIDPGLNNIGIAIFDVDATKEAPTSLTAFTVLVEKAQDTSGFDDQDVIARQHKLETIKNLFAKILKDYKPEVVFCESPFFDPRKPNAFEALVQVMLKIFEALSEYDKNLTLERFSPQEVKKTFNISGKLGKDIVKEAVSKCEELKPLLPEDFEFYSEHAIDATAVGFTGIMVRRHRLKEGVKDEKQQK